jgi:hypothetical protein
MPAFQQSLQRGFGHHQWIDCARDVEQVAAIRGKTAKEILG